MDKRSVKNSQGDESEGLKLNEMHANAILSEKLVAVGQILYLVRSNLFHGSKVDWDLDSWWGWQPHRSNTVMPNPVIN